MIFARWQQPAVGSDFTEVELCNRVTSHNTCYWIFLYSRIVNVWRINVWKSRTVQSAEKCENWYKLQNYNCCRHRPTLFPFVFKATWLDLTWTWLSVTYRQRVLLILLYIFLCLYVLDLFIRAFFLSFVRPLQYFVNTLFWKQMNRLRWKLAQVVHGARLGNDQLCSSAYGALQICLWLWLWTFGVRKSKIEVTRRLTCGGQAEAYSRPLQSSKFSRFVYL